MNTIETLNFTIHSESKAAHKFLNRMSMHFKGSTTIFYIIARLFFRHTYSFEINGVRKIWPIDSISDLRLIRGDFDGTANAYAIKTGYEGVDLSYIKTLIKEGDLLLDLGANKGFYTLFFSSLVGNTGKVIAIEGDPGNYKTYLQRVKYTWNLANVLPLNFILSKTNGDLVSMNKPSLFDDGTGLSLRLTKRSINSSYTRKLDDLLNLLGNEKIKMLKIDVEGAEFLVLSGATKTMERVDFLLVEVSETGIKKFGTTVKELYTLLEQSGFDHAYTISQSEQGVPKLERVNGQVGNVLFSRRQLLA